MNDECGMIDVQKRIGVTGSSFIILYPSFIIVCLCLSFIHHSSKSTVVVVAVLV